MAQLGLFLLIKILCLSAAYSKESQPALSKSAPVAEEVYQVLFELNNEALTTIDFKHYLEYQKQLKSDGVWPQQNDLNEFLMVEIAALEAKNLDLKIKAVKSSIPLKYQLAKEFLALKEKQFSSADRYVAWLDLLKRKYNFSVKSDEARVYFKR